MLDYTTPRSVASLARQAMRATVTELEDGLWLHQRRENYRTTRWSVYRHDQLLASRCSLRQALAEAAAQLEEEQRVEALVARYEEMRDAQYDAISANWGHD